MLNVITISLLVKLIIAIAAYVAIRVTLRQLDNVSGIDFKGWTQSADNESLALYFAVRLLAICILFGLILSS